MKPDQLNSAVTQIVGDVEISALQIVMIGPDKAEIKARRADDDEWCQGIIHCENPLRSPRVYRPREDDMSNREKVAAKSAEQQARDLLERYGVEDAQSWTAGDLIELANLTADANAYRRSKEMLMTLDATCGLCGGESDWRVEFGDRHTGACSEHLPWACRLFQTSVHVSTEVSVSPTPDGVVADLRRRTEFNPRWQMTAPGSFTLPDGDIVT